MLQESRKQSKDSKLRPAQPIMTVDKIHRSEHEMRQFLYILEPTKKDNLQPIARVGKTLEFYDRPDQSYQLPKESG